jgi:FKBP-type peptidyl-prolyl cis-trans isomerase
MAINALLVAALLTQGAAKVQIKNVAPGKGPGVQVGDFVTAHYTGKLTNGKKFDSSRDREPFKFLVGAGQVIKGWDLGFVGMKAGGKRTLTIPAVLGYGAQGHPPDIPGGATLIFDVDLLSIERAKVVTTKKGTGPGAKFGDTVQVHYTGKLADGKKFDSSLDRNQPFQVTIGKTGLIPGFTQGLLGLKLGEKRTVTIPPSLGYGARGAGGVIPPNATITFDLELVQFDSRSGQ